MKNFVLAIIEPDMFPDEVAKRAVWIANEYGCDLELLLCDPMLSLFGDSFIASTETQRLVDSVKQVQQAIIGDIAESASKGDVHIEANVLYERPISDAIINKAVDSDPAFVVKGTSFHSPAERATFTFTDWRLIRKLDCPVWLVKGTEWKEHPVIVGAVDPTHQHDPQAVMDKNIVEAGKTLASKTDGKLVLLHTYQRLDDIGSRAIKRFKPIKLNIDEIDKKTRETHQHELDALARAHDIPSDDVHQLPGRTREILPSFVRAKGADIVIMGAIARTGLKRRMLGSTAEQVLDHLPCDILLVREA